MKYDKEEANKVGRAATVILNKLYGIRGAENEECQADADPNIFDPGLDVYQREAVKRCAGGEPVSIIHGPPGEDRD